MTSPKGRRLLAVMFTDVVGYTALMQRDEEAARIVRRRHRQALDAAVPAHRGDLLQYMGDGSLTVFPSVVDAVRAAIEVQRGLRQEPIVPLRIGIHQGDISYDTQGPYGDSINIASRIESLGIAGSILISAKAHDEIKNQPDISTTPLGEFELKNIEEPLAVYAIVSDVLAIPSRGDVLAGIRSAPASLSDAIIRLNTALEGRYAIERELGETGMATVYLADDLKHERKVALRVLKPELAAVVGAKRFLAEIKVTANLKHPHILPLHDSGEADSFLFYVMPYVEGESLRDRIDREKQLPVDEAVRIATAVANALDHAHRHKVIHRDIKPANILLQDGEPVVADFGIALAIGAAGGTRLTETGLSLETPYYMSPEQATGDQPVGASTDTYALGSVLYEMLTGDPPYMGSTTQAVLGQIISAKPISATEKRPAIPANVDAALRKALEKLPADRFTSAQDFANALHDEHFRYGETTERVGVAAVGLWKRVAILGWSAAALLSALALLSVLGRFTGPEASPLLLELDLGAIAPHTESDVIVSPDGLRFAVAGQVEGVRELYVRGGGERDFRRIAGTEGAEHPAFSPDGAWVVYKNGAELLKVAFEGGLPVPVLGPGVVRSPEHPHWGPDGTIVFRGNRSAVYRMADTGDDEPELLRSGLPDALFPRLLPGGRGILLTYAEGIGSSGSDPFRFAGARDIQVLDLRSDSVRTLVADAVDAVYVETGHLLYAHRGGGLFAVAFDLDALEVTGASPVPVLEDVGMSTSQAKYWVSATGTLVYGTGGARPGDAPLSNRLVVEHFGGGSDTLGLAPRVFGSPRWAPDGRSVAFYDGVAGNTSIYVYDLVTAAGPQQVTRGGEDRYPVWSPDGLRIGFSSRRSGTESWDLFVTTLGDDTPAKQILALPDQQDMRDWTGGDLLVFEHFMVNGQSSLWVSAPSGDNPRPYFESESDLDDIVVSRDGQWAAYQSTEGSFGLSEAEGAQEVVFVRSFPEAGELFRVSEGEGQFPRWSPDGRTIYYWAAETAVVDTLWAARIQTEPTFEVLSREVMLVGDYVAEYWDVHPEGDRIVVSQPINSSAAAPVDEEDAVRYYVVTNFFEELKERVGN